jgi:hypothetical protein
VYIALKYLWLVLYIFPVLYEIMKGNLASKWSGTLELDYS